MKILIKEPKDEQRGTVILKRVKPGEVIRRRHPSHNSESEDADYWIRCTVSSADNTDVMIVNLKLGHVLWLHPETLVTVHDAELKVDSEPRR